jgi:3-deoxy-D-manno-octulosonic-acid transferase
MIEPCAYGAAVLFGPNTWNFRHVVELLVSGEAAIVVQSGAALTAAVRRLLGDRAESRALGRRAQQLVCSQQGATGRTVEILRDLLPPRAAARSAA